MTSHVFPAQFFSKPRLVSLGKQRIVFGGSDLRFKCEKFGWLDQFLIRVNSTYDVAVANLVFKPRAPRNMLSRLKLTPPGREKFSDTMGGYGFHLFDLTQRGHGPYAGTSRRVDVDGLDANAGTSAQVEAFDNAIGAGKVALLWWTVNMRRSASDPRGRIPLQNDSDTLLYLTPAPKGDLVTVPANFLNDVLDVEVFQVTYDEVPDSDKIKQFSRSWAIIHEEFDQVAIIGNNDVVMPVGDDRIYLGWYHALALDDTGMATSGKIDTLDLKADKTDIIEPATDAGAFFYDVRRKLGHVLPDGVVFYDFDHYADSDGSFAAGEPDPEETPKYEPSIGRWLNTRNTKSLRSRLHIPAGTALGAAPRIVTGIRYMVKVA